jgi:hypothetical protein
MATRATRMERISLLLVKWTSLFLILLAVMVTTASGEVSPLVRANPSRTAVEASSKCMHLANQTCTTQTTCPTFTYCIVNTMNSSSTTPTTCPTTSSRSKLCSKPITNFACKTNNGIKCIRGTNKRTILCLTASSTSTTCTTGNADFVCQTMDNSSCISTSNTHTSSCFIISLTATTCTTSNTGFGCQTIINTVNCIPGTSKPTSKCPTASLQSTTCTTGTTGSACQTINTIDCIPGTIIPVSVGSPSPSGNNGQPAAAGQCPPGPSGVTVNYDTEGVQLQCYYALPSGGSCTPPYQMSGTWCVASPQFSCPRFMGPAPGLQGATCIYTLSHGQSCAPGYINMDVNYCESNATLSSGPAPVCPGTLQNVPCTAQNGYFTCPPGYIYLTNGCDANPIAFLIDQSKTCTGLLFPSSSSSSSSPALPLAPSSSSSSSSSALDLSSLPYYTCVYGNGVTLTCHITGSSDICTMTQPSSSGATVFSSYVCSNIDPHTGDFADSGSSGCNYYGTNPFGPPSPSTPVTMLASSTCQLTGTGSSSIDCQIVACFDTLSIHSTGTYTFIPCPSGSQILTPSVIEVKIDQICTQVANGQPLTCTYGDWMTGATKTESIEVDCQQVAPHPLICIAMDPYGRAITKACHNDNPGISTCFITNGISSSSSSGISSSSSSPTLWVEKCSPSISSVLPKCEIDDQSGNNPLGLISCSNNTTCTVTDDSHNTITLNCTLPSLGTTCTSSKPDCPHTDPVPSGPAPASLAVTESTMACDASLLVDLFMSTDTTYSPTFGGPRFTLTFPLSQAELEFVLTKLGIGSQTWPSASTSPNLPTVTYLSLRR